MLEDKICGILRNLFTKRRIEDSAAGVGRLEEDHRKPVILERYHRHYVGKPESQD